MKNTIPYAPKETTKQDSAFAQAMLRQQTLFPNMPKSYNKTQENNFDFYNYNTININGEDAEENAKQIKSGALLSLCNSLFEVMGRRTRRIRRNNDCF